MIKIYYLLPVVIFLAAGLAPRVIFADCEAGSWACSPSGNAAGTVEGGGMYQCINGSYQQQTSCGAGAKCCMIDNTPKCIALATTCGAAAEPDACDINSADAKTCCKCDTGAMCLGASNTYRKCVGGCYQELSCGSGKSLCGQITQPCPTPQTKCTEPGSVVPSKKADGANYLNICATDYTANEIQCSLTLKQKEAAACYQAQTNGLSAAVASIKSDDGFSITSQRIQTGVDANFKPIYGGTKFVINDSNGMTDCQNLGDPLQSSQTTTNDIRGKLGCAASQSTQTSSALCQSLELACCLTGDHCQSKGCDQNIVYDSYYGCTKINFGKQLVVKKSDGTDCGVCALQTFGCGEGLTTKDASGIYAYKKCEPNTDATAGAPKGCWGKEEIGCSGADVNHCASFCDVSAGLGIQIWDAQAIKDLAAKKVSAPPGPSTSGCQEFKCFNTADSGEIKKWDGASNAPNCNYLASKDPEQALCKRCHDDVEKRAAVCDVSAGVHVGDNYIFCDPGAVPCGNSCYNPSKREVCSQGGFISCTGSPFICNDHNSIMKLGPTIIDGGKDSACDYVIPWQVCPTDQMCRGYDHCYADKDWPQTADYQIGAWVGQYDHDNNAVKTIADDLKSGQMVDRKTKKPITPQKLYIDTVARQAVDAKTANASGHPIITVECDQQGCATLNAALAFIGSSTIKDKPYIGPQMAPNGVSFVEGPGTYVCLNYAYDTENMLKEKFKKSEAINDVYSVSIEGIDTNGDEVPHAVNAIKTGEVEYTHKDTNGNVVVDGVLPTFVVIEPQGGVVMGQLGIDGATPITDFDNHPYCLAKDAFRIKNAAVVDNYKITPYGGMLASRDSNIYTFTEFKRSSLEPVPLRVE